MGNETSSTSCRFWGLFSHAFEALLCYLNLEKGASATKGTAIVLEVFSIVFLEWPGAITRIVHFTVSQSNGSKENNTSVTGAQQV